MSHAYQLLSSLKQTKFNNEILMACYVQVGKECYENNDFSGRDYWNERYFQMSCENELLEKDIRKIKEELKLP